MRRKILLPLFMVLLTGIITAENLRIVSPNGGEILSIKKSVQIQWETSNINGKVVIILYKKENKVLTISNGAPNTGKFLWRIPPKTAPHKNYRIRIRSLKKLTVNDFSDRDFTIIP